MMPSLTSQQRTHQNSLYRGDNLVVRFSFVPGMHIVLVHLSLRQVFSQVCRYACSVYFARPYKKKCRLFSLRTHVRPAFPLAW